MLRKIFLTWVLFIPIAIANGVLRETTYKYLVGDLAAHQIGTMIIVSAFVVWVYILRKDDFKLLGDSKLFAIGLSWVVMTILFEFGFGHFIDGISWEKLVADYNIFQGRVWSLMLLGQLFTPKIVKLVSNLRR